MQSRICMLTVLHIHIFRLLYTLYLIFSPFKIIYNSSRFYIFPFTFLLHLYFIYNLFYLFHFTDFCLINYISTHTHTHTRARALARAHTHTHTHTHNIEVYFMKKTIKSKNNVSISLHLESLLLINYYFLRLIKTLCLDEQTLEFLFYSIKM